MAPPTTMVVADDDDVPRVVKVAPHEFADTGRGHRVLERVARGDVLLEVPIEIGFTAAAAMADAEVGAVASACARHDDLVALLICVEVERGEGAERAGHCASLPESFDTAFYWSPEELEELKGTVCLRDTMSLIEETAQDFENIRGKLEKMGRGTWLEDHGVTYERYAWARSNLWSRQCDLLMPDGKRTRAMVPTFDIFNHSPDAPLGKTHKLNAERGLVTVYASKDYEPGEQAFISYGSGEAANSKLLTWYGFCVENNPYEELDLTLTVSVNKLRKTVLEAALMASAVAYLTDIDDRWQESGDYAEPYLPMLYQSLHTPKMEDLEADGSSAEFIVKHTVPEREPLPPTLRIMARVQQLSDSELADPEIRQAVMESANDKSGETIVSMANELAALASLKLIFQDVIDGFVIGSAEDDEAELAKPFDQVPYRKRLALLVRSGERRIATKAYAMSSMEFDKAVRDVTKTAITRTQGLCENKKCLTCASSGCRWLHELRKQKPNIEAVLPAVSKCARAIEDALPLAAHLQTINLAYVWLMGRLDDDDVAPRAALNLPTWPLNTDQCDASAYADLDEMAKLAIDGSAGEEHAHNGKEGEMLLPGVYTAKVKTWGAWILAQWAVCGIFDITDLNAIGSEAASLKRRHACSIPTRTALDALGELGPLVEIGSGGGLWARRLSERGYDVVAYNTPQFDEDYHDGGAAHIASMKLTEVSWFDNMRTGGPESAKEHADRALVLMWPDISGDGEYGLTALENYEGNILVTVGEWHDHTFGEYAPGATASGMSFSAECQDLVASRFELERVIPVGNWPMFDSVAMIWRARK